MKLNRIIILLLLVFSAFSICSAENEIIRAMHDELERSLQSLKLGNLQKPYYIEYKLTIRNSKTIKAELGALSESSESKHATLSVGVRVGSYKFDNTNFFDFGLNFFGSSDDEESFKSRTITFEPDYKSLRRELWLATDAAYKQISEIYSKKEATLKNRIIKDTTHDFIELPPEQNFDTAKIPDFDVTQYETLARKLSSIFTAYPKINISSVGIEYLPETVYYLNSEGREYIKNDFYAGLEVVASTQADDGMPLMNFYSAYAHNPNDLPTTDSLSLAVKQVADKLTELKSAETLDEPYSGPVLFEGQAAAEVFAQVFAPNLVTQRDMLTEQGIQENDRYTAFQSKIGGRVLPEFLSVNDLSSSEHYGDYKTALLGHVKIDDEGVLTQDVNLVKDGYLKNLLSSRVPTKRVRQSNGHNLGGAPMFSTLVIKPADESDAETFEELKNKMIALCKDRELPFGIIVKKAINQNIMYTTLFRMTSGDFPMTQLQAKIPLIETYKLYPDGREVLVRGSEAKGFTAQSFKDIIKISDDQYIMNFLAPAVTSPFVTGGRQYVGATVITGDLLFEDGEIRSEESDFPKPPIIPGPLSGK